MVQISCILINLGKNYHAMAWQNYGPVEALLCLWGFLLGHWGALKRNLNQSQKDLMRSVVPGPCFFDVVKSQRVAKQQGDKNR